MKIYRISYHDPMGESKGFSHHASKREAEREKLTAEGASHPPQECEIEIIHVMPTRKGIIRALNVYGGHPDNG